ncbi:hypothetical protein Tsubulata_044339 [Turnera subulata]|uniref:Uncharacterized protein n=1 Tax=Turnera subulata TaxID=218843 RepID=A0A9Q0JD46_9ROSI|nr:hypothetical protein Tsubulata_044339 [Turnera subulata]
MGFLHKLWDETLAGPAPEAGLGKLRKYDSFSGRSSPRMVSNINNPEAGICITRSITVLRRNNNNLPLDPEGSGRESPSVPITPGTPFSPGTPPGYFRRAGSRRSTVRAAENVDEQRTPTANYDWVIMSALDR